MINRLVAENSFKIALSGSPFFSVNKKLLCFQTASHIKVKPLTKDFNDIDIAFNPPPLQFALSQSQPWVMVLTKTHLLEMYLIEYINGVAEGSYKKVAILHNVFSFQETKSGLAIVAANNTLKVITYKQIAEMTEENLNIDANTLKSLTELTTPFTLRADPNNDRIIICKQAPAQAHEKQNISEIFDRVGKAGKYERTYTVSYLHDIIAIYKERFVLQLKNQNEIEILDVTESKVVGKFGAKIEGNIKYTQIKQNLLLMISSKDNTDYFHFIVLHHQPSSSKPIITNRALYEKGKGDFYRIFNMETIEAALVFEKKKNAELTWNKVSKVGQTTTSVLFIFNKTKDKLQTIKLDHSKILKSPFGEEKVDMIIYSKKNSGHLQAKKKEEVEIQRSRIHSSMEIKLNDKNIEEMQKKFVQNLIDIKLKGVMKKFSELERKVEDLQKTIRTINEKIERNLQKINRQQIKQNVEKMFDSLTPQFERYFSEIFKQVAGVLDQGVNYYNLKLAKEAEIHKDALCQIVEETFKASEEIVKIGKKEQSIAEKTQEHLRKIFEAKRKWTKSTQEFQSSNKEIPSPTGKGAGTEVKPEGKVFVRADLNYSNTRKEG